MDLLARYLQALKFWLPSAQQDDIVAELREDICSEIDEHEKELGRKLTDVELEALLKQRGRPLLVAQKYLPQRSLIGPILFPIYWFVLRIVWLCYLIPWGVTWICLVLFSQQYRAHHLGAAAVGDASSLVTHAFIATAVVTMVFAAIEHAKHKTWLTDDWSPSKLPPVRDTHRISRASMVMDLVVGFIFGVWWLEILQTLTIINSDSLKIMLNPAWHRWFWVFFALWIGNMALSGVNLWRPYWTRTRRAAKASLNFAIAIVLAFIVRIQPALIVTMPSTRAAKALEGSLDLTLLISFAIAAIIAVVIGCVELWRIYSGQDRQRPLQHRVAA